MRGARRRELWALRQASDLETARRQAQELQRLAVVGLERMEAARR